MYHCRILFLLVLLCGSTVPLVPARAGDNGSGGSDSGSDGSGGSDSGSDDSDGGDSGSDDSGGSDPGDKNSGKDDSGGGSQTDDDNDHSGKDDIKEVEDQRRAADAVSSGNAATLKEILAKVRKQYRGDVVRVSLRGEGRNLTYRIKLLNENNRLIEVQVNAVNRQILQVKGM